MSLKIQQNLDKHSLLRDNIFMTTLLRPFCLHCHIKGALYCAVRNYFTKKADEVSVPIGSVVEVLKMSDDGWWLTR